jgi:proteic killer suppression protein
MTKNPPDNSTYRNQSEAKKRYIQVARRKLRMLTNAKQLNDLQIPPNNRLEQLKGNRLGEYSIRINRQWRITFKWKNNEVYDIEIEDYH